MNKEMTLTLGSLFDGSGGFPGVIPKFSLCSDGVQWFQQHGQWQDRNYTPTAGNIH